MRVVQTSPPQGECPDFLNGPKKTMQSTETEYRTERQVFEDPKAANRLIETPTGKADDTEELSVFFLGKVGPLLTSRQAHT
jgi:hypothetical protein